MELRLNNGFYTPYPTGNSGKTRDSAPQTRALTPSNDTAQPLEAKSAPSKTADTPHTRLTMEKTEATENGTRRTSIFQQTDGRTFSRMEEISLGANGSRRNVIQQNPSGTMTEYEEVLDREPAGTFRRTQRFRNEAGEASTKITQGFRVEDPFILTGGKALPFKGAPNTPFSTSRGTQVDLSA